MVDADGTIEEGPLRIMNSRDQVLQCKTMRLVKVLWQHQGVEKATWNAKTRYMPIILSYSRRKVYF